MSLNESITKVSPLIQSSNGSSLDDLIVSWQIEEEIETNNPPEERTLFSNDLNWMDFLKLPLSSSDSDSSNPIWGSPENDTNRKSIELSLKSNKTPSTRFPLRYNQPSIPLNTSLGIPSPQPKGIPRGHIKLPEWFEEPKNSADMPAFLRKLRTRYIHIHRRLYFLNNEKLSLLSYLQSKFQNDSQPDAFLQSACHHVHHSSEPLPQETILNQSEIQKRPMLSPHTTEWHPKETTLCDSDTAFQSNTHVHHNIQFTCTNNGISSKPSCLTEISHNHHSPIVLNDVLQENFKDEDSAISPMKFSSMRVRNSCKRSYTTKQQNKTKRQALATVCLHTQSSTDSFPLSYWTSLPTNILRLWMSFFGLKSAKSSVSRSSIVCSLSKISQYVSLDT